jgi:hypothetical protein
MCTDLNILRVGCQDLGRAGIALDTQAYCEHWAASQYPAAHLLPVREVVSSDARNSQRQEIPQHVPVLAGGVEHGR